ncbi:MAG TPA: CoA-binding protein [Bacteroidetes bacterium]|nr:CoA-binding protein [Bacteroidota bacterium]
MDLKSIFEKNKNIAVVGFSDKSYRDSFNIARYLKSKGFNVFGVNPRLKGMNIEGIQCYEKLEDIPEDIHIVNVFRNPECLVDLVNEVSKLKKKPNVIWTQLEVINPEAKKIAEERDFIYIENKCIFVEHRNISLN